QRRLACRLVASPTAETGGLGLVDVEVVPCRRLGRGRDDRSREPLRLLEPDRQLVTADGAGLEVVLPPGAGQVAADDDLDRHHLETPALEGASVVAEGEDVVGDDVRRSCEPEGRQPGENAALVRDR